METKSSADRYKTKNGKLYLADIFLGGETAEKWNQIFPSGKTNTRDAKEFMTKNYPENTDFLLERSQNFDWYEVFTEKSVLDIMLWKDIDIRHNRVNWLSKSKIRE